MKDLVKSIFILFFYFSCNYAVNFKVDNTTTSTDPNDINLNQSVATALRFDVEPSNSVSTEIVNPVIKVKVVDEANNLVTSSSASISLSLDTDPSGGASTLGGTTTVTAVDGVATFSDISIDKAFSGYTLLASSSGLTSVTSSSFEISVGAASNLEIVSQPTASGVNSILSPGVSVKVVDAGGNTISSFSNSITIAIATNPSAGSLSGTTTLSAVSGIATFSDLSIDTAGVGYTLQASSVGLSNTESTTFNIIAPYSLSAGFMSTCVNLNSSVKCFGQNSVYELGNGTDIDTSYMVTPAPTQVLDASGAIATDIVSTIISPYSDTACSLLTSSEVRCMGRGANGQRGDGTLSNTSLPTFIQESVSSNLSNITKLALSSLGRTCVVSLGNLYCMGDNTGPTSTRHQVISGNTCSAFLDQTSCDANNACTWNVSSCIKTQYVTYAAMITSGVVDVATGDEHICILNASNDVMCWGENSNAQLGNGNTTDIDNGYGAATTVSGLVGDTIVEIQAGCNNTCALLADETVKCWGQGLYGQNGTNSTSDQNSALAVLDPTGSVPLSNITQMSIGCFHSCFVTSTNKLYCVGDNIEGEIGVSSNPKELLVIEHPTLTNITQVATGIDHTCALDTSNKVYCWGANYAGESGHDQGSSSTLPIEVQGL